MSEERINLFERHKADINFNVWLKHRKSGLYVCGNGLTVHKKPLTFNVVNTTCPTILELLSDFIDDDATYLKSFNAEDFEIESAVG